MGNLRSLLLLPGEDALWLGTVWQVWVSEAQSWLQ